MKITGVPKNEGKQAHLFSALRTSSSANSAFFQSSKMIHFRLRSKLSLLLLLFIVISCNNREDAIFSAPDFTLPDIYGNNVQLYSLLGQGPVVFVPWALWCKICIKELDALVPYADTLNAVNCQILAISQNRSQSLEEILVFARIHGWFGHYRILLDTANIIRDLYDIQAMPSTIVIDMNGDIVYRHEGYKTGDEIGIMDTLKAMFGD